MSSSSHPHGGTTPARAHTLGPAIALACVACACATAGTLPSDAGADAPDAPSPPPLDPRLFDCTSLAGGLPARKAASSPACLRDPKCKTRLVAAHRGAGGQLGRIAPEDTLAAYRAGIAMGVDLVETDPRPTSDGVLVNVHDPTLDRTTSGTGNVDQHTFAQIRALAIKADGLAGDFACEKVPTLRELLELCAGRAMVLVDANKTSRVDLLVGAIQQTSALDWAVFDTSDTAKIDQALALEPKLMIMPRVASGPEATAVLAKYATHLPVFVELDSATFPAGAAEVHAGGTRALTDVFGIDLGVKLGSDPKAYLEPYASGADVAQTDLPDLVLKALGRPVPP